MPGEGSGTAEPFHTFYIRRKVIVGKLAARIQLTANWAQPFKFNLDAVSLQSANFRLSVMERAPENSMGEQYADDLKKRPSIEKLSR